MIPRMVIGFTNIALAVFVNLLLTPVLSAQISSDSSLAAQRLAEAELLAKEQQYKRSTREALKAIEGFERIGKWENCLDAYYQIFFNAYVSQQYTEAINQLEQSLQRLPAEQAGIRARLYSYLGFLYDNIGNIFASLAAYEASLPHLKATNDSLRIAKVYGNLGVTYIQLGDYLKAVQYLKTACALGRLLPEPQTLWNNLVNLGDAYFYMGDWRAAQQGYQQARQLKDPEDGTLDFYEAKVQLEAGRFQNALSLNRSAIRKMQEAYGKVPAYTAGMERLEGEIYLRDQEYRKAYKIFKGLLPYYKKGPNRRELGKLYVLMGDAQKASKQFDRALSNYQKALQTFLPDFEDKQPESNPSEKDWSREVWLMEIFRAKGDCFLGKYRKKNKEKWLKLAEENYQLAVRFIEKVKLSYSEIESKLILGEYTHFFYEELIRIQLERYRLTQNQRELEQAFKVAQRANAFVLRELLSEQAALQIAGVAQDTIAQLKAIGQQISIIHQQMEGARDSLWEVREQQLFDWKEQQRDLKKAIVRQHPVFNQLRNDLEVPSSRQLQEQLDDSSLLIKYFLGEDHLYIFSISHTDFHVDTLALPAHFDELVGQYRRSISDLEFITDSMALAEQQYLESARQLYNLLLEQPLQHYRESPSIKRLRIVGDGILNTIPFPALLAQPSSSWSDPEPLVVSRYAISYAYFCKMLLSKESAGRSGQFMSFGLEFDDYTLQYLQKLSKDSIKSPSLLHHLRSGALSNLPFSDDEALELADLMEGEAWVNEKATKSNFLKHIPDARIIHTATHSLLDEDQPARSSLIFTKTKDSLDNLLRLKEIYDLRLDAEMIVLSACNTGYGRRERGEGINSLARAFNFAGIPSVVATYWNISDEASKKLMELYYKALREGKPKDVALQQAQLEYLRNDKVSSPVFRLPVYWAAWMSIGDNRSLEMSRGFSFLELAGILFTGLLIVLIGVGRKRSAGE